MFVFLKINDTLLQLVHNFKAHIQRLVTNSNTGPRILPTFSRNQEEQPH
jgi:hypothetical protein